MDNKRDEFNELEQIFKKSLYNDDKLTNTLTQNKELAIEAINQLLSLFPELAQKIDAEEISPQKVPFVLETLEKISKNLIRLVEKIERKEVSVDINQVKEGDYFAKRSKKTIAKEALLDHLKFLDKQIRALKETLNYLKPTDFTYHSIIESIVNLSNAYRKVASTIYEIEITEKRLKQKERELALKEANLRFAMQKWEEEKRLKELEKQLEFEQRKKLEDYKHALKMKEYDKSLENQLKIARKKIELKVELQKKLLEIERTVETNALGVEDLIKAIEVLKKSEEKDSV